MTSRTCVVLCFLFVLPTSGCNSGDDRKTAASGVDNTRIGDSTLVAMSDYQAELLKDTLLAEGKYECCTMPGCLECVKRERECTCYVDLKKKDPICGECLEGYKNGKGKLKLVSIPELEQTRNARGSGN